LSEKEAAQKAGASAPARLKPPRREVLFALGLGLVGGILFAWLRLPLAWMLGPMLATTIASISGLRVAIPGTWRIPTIAVLGVLLGSGFNEDAAARVVQWLPSLAALPAYIAVITGIAIAYLRRVGRLDLKTAYFCATPGGLGEMAVLGDQMGGDMRMISLVHATRILLVVFTVPIAYRLLGMAPAGAAAARPPGAPLDLAILLLCGVVGIFLGKWARLPAFALVGPMLVSAAAHLTGLVHGAPPQALVSAAQLVIGASVGCRFMGFPVARVVWTILTGSGLTVLMLGVALGFGAAVAWLSGIPFAVVFLAFVPGGLAEMSLVALALTDDPAFVATNHIVRVALVVFLAPMLYGLYRRWLKLPG
jgi:membrane AbrB-like protein